MSFNLIQIAITLIGLMGVEGPDKPGTLEEGMSQELSSALANPNLGGGINLMEDYVSVQHNEGKESIALRLSFEYSDPIQKNQKVSFKKVFVELSGPLKKDQERVDLASFDNFSVSHNGEIGFNYSIFPAVQQGAIDLLSEYIALFLKANPNWVGTDISTSDFSKPLLNEYEEKLGKIMPQGSWNFSASYKAGYQQFSYLGPYPDEVEAGDDLSGLYTPLRDSKLGHSFNLASGYLSSTSFFGLNVKKKVEYNPAPQQSICYVSPDRPDLLICDEQALAPPVKSDTFVSQLEYRYLGSKYAVNPRVTHNHDANLTNAEVQVYLIRNKEHLFTGGLSLQYLEKGRETKLSLFVGKPFALVKSK